MIGALLAPGQRQELREIVIVAELALGGLAVELGDIEFRAVGEECVTPANEDLAFVTIRPVVGGVAHTLQFGESKARPGSFCLRCFERRRKGGRTHGCDETLQNGTATNAFFENGAVARRKCTPRIGTRSGLLAVRHDYLR